MSDLNGQKPHVSSSSTREKLRPTVGESAIKAAEQTSPSRNPIELEREMHKDYEQNIYESIQKGRSIFPNSFYIKVITKRERLLTNVIRNYFVLVVACPSPDWDQTIYYYDRPKETLSLLWVIPCRDACKYLIEHANEVVKEEQNLLAYIFRFYNGDLIKLAKKLNNEQEHSPLLIS